MPMTPEGQNSLVQRLSEVRPIRHRAMFGGIGFYLDDAFFAVADDDRLYFKVDASSAAEYEAYGMGPWHVGGAANSKYREVPAEVFDDPERLGEWIDRAAQVARAATPKKRR